MHCRLTPCPIRVQSDEEYTSHYLRSGMVEKQFRHHVALAFTREYVQLHGVTYTEKAVKKYLGKIDKFYENIQEFTIFCERISRYRYAEDAFAQENEIYFPLNDVGETGTPLNN